jgi:glucose/arabinose dehydrogenase
MLFASGLNLPFGMAIHNGFFYVANTSSVVRYAYAAGQESVSGPETVIPSIPSLGYNMHWTRNIIFDPSGSKMYLTIGSETNKGVDPLPRAAIYRYNPDGSGKELLVTGIRNPVGLAWQPGTGELWTTVVERDYMGDDLVPDYFTRVRKGQFFGWPWYYIGKHRDPKTSLRGAPKTPVTVPDNLFLAHSTPLGVLFYTGSMFPSEYRGDAIIAMRGATNRKHRSGYKIVRVRFKNGKLIPGYEDFITGWLPDPLKKEVYGRPVGLAQLPDGSLLIADEGGNCVWRVTYR